MYGVKDKTIEEGIMKQIGRYVFLSPVIFSKRIPMKKKALMSTLLCLGISLCLLTSMTAFGWAQAKQAAPAERGQVPAKPAATPKPAAPAKLPQPRHGGILRIGTAVDSNVLGYPPGMLTTQDFVTSKTCIESLGRYDNKGLMSPWLAESWKTDAKAKTITLKLRKGVKFHDGTDFNAAAVKWNIEKYIAAKRTELPAVASIDIIDNYTLRLTLVEWDNTAIIGMGYFAGPQISPTAWQKAGATDKDRDDWAKTNPVGTGPFQFVSRQRDVKQVYKKFDAYWQKGKPYLDGIEWNFIADPMVLQAAFRTKELDILWAIPPLAARDLRASGADITELKTGLGLMMMGIMPNSALPDSPFAKLKVRQALSYALDTKSILDAVYYGFATATQQWGMPNSYWSNPAFKGYPYNPKKAKQLIAEAGYPQGIKTKLLALNAPEHVAAATAIQDMLAKVGINAELDVADNGRYRQLTSQTNFEGLCFASYRAGAEDPALIMPRNLSAGGAVMVKSIMHPEKIEKMLVEAKQAPDQKNKRAQIWRLQQVVFGEYSIFSPMLIISGLAAKQPNVHNDGLMTVELTQWTPEDAWKDK
jgi:peptide/nickel transport system substrate-binding protein